MIIHTAEQAISRLPHIQLDSAFTPAQIVHMIVAGGASQTLYNIDSGIHQRAMEFLCQETHRISNYPIAGGLIREDRSGPYFAAGTEDFPASRMENEFLGMLAAAGINLQNTLVITSEGNEATLADMAQKAMADYNGSSRECAWSLMLFSVMPGITQEWKNADGDLWSVEKILRSACSLPYGYGSCFGTHTIEGIAFAVSRYCLEQDVEPSQLTGIWENAFEYVLGAMRLMQKNQKDDGSIDRCWFRTKRYPQTMPQWREKLKDIASRRVFPAKAIVYPTGHCLDAISSLGGFWNAEREWMDNACYIVAHTIDTQWPELAGQVSALAHGIHALKLLDV